MSVILRSRLVHSVVAVLLGIVMLATAQQASGATPGNSLAAGLFATEPIAAGRYQFERVRRLTTMHESNVLHVDRFFNAQSCVECHRLGGVGGAGPNENNVQLINSPTMAALLQATLNRAGASPSIARVGSKSENASDVLAEAGKLFKPISNDGITMLHRRSTLAGYDLLRLEALQKFDPKHPEVVARLRTVQGKPAVQPEPKGVAFRGLPIVEERNTPALFGLGLIESIPQEELDVIAELQPEAMRGRSPRLRTGGRGRFGWKSQNATLAGFNEGACAAELGLRTSKFEPSERRAFGLRAVPLGERVLPTTETEMTDDEVTSLSVYVASLPAPRQVYHLDDEMVVRQGETLFNAAGCAVCHRPDVGRVAGIYSDLLLHDVGTTGSVVYYDRQNGPSAESFDIVSAAEIRTPPLWGVADSGPYMHDGASATLEDAILRHDRQALESVRHYRYVFDTEERARVLAFLKSLRAPNTLPERQTLPVSRIP